MRFLPHVDLSTMVLPILFNNQKGKKKMKKKRMDYGTLHSPPLLPFFNIFSLQQNKNNNLETFG
jgi:hypothetical protein